VTWTVVPSGNHLRLVWVNFTIIMYTGSDCADNWLLDSFAGISGEILIHMLDNGEMIWILV